MLNNIFSKEKLNFPSCEGQTRTRTRKRTRKYSKFNIQPHNGSTHGFTNSTKDKNNQYYKVYSRNGHSLLHRNAVIKFEGFIFYSFIFFYTFLHESSITRQTKNLNVAINVINKLLTRYYWFKLSTLAGSESRTNPLIVCVFTLLLFSLNGFPCFENKTKSQFFLIVLVGYFLIYLTNITVHVTNLAEDPLLLMF